MKYTINSISKQLGRGNTADVKWDVYEIAPSVLKKLQLSGTIFSDFRKIYKMPYRVTSDDIKKIQSNPEELIQPRALPLDKRPSLDSTTGNVHLDTRNANNSQLLFVREVPGGHHGVKVDNEMAEKNPQISYNIFQKDDKIYYTPKACYYPPIDETKFETKEENQIQKFLKSIF